MRRETKDSFETLRDYVEQKKRDTLAAYKASLDLVEEQHNRETTILSGGYAYRQLFELIQNAADAINVGGDSSGTIRVQLDKTTLRVSNTGASLDRDGVKALLQADTSSKRDNQIGRFGIGFKSLLNLGGRIDILSRSIGLRFDPEDCRSKIRLAVGLNDDAPAPGMRLAECLDPNAPDSLFHDRDYEFFDTVVSAELDVPDAFETLEKEINRFPAAFLLFLEADVKLCFQVDGEVRRELTRVRNKTENRNVEIRENDEVQEWRLFQSEITISDPKALRDATMIQARGKVPLSWAVPVGGRMAGKFWAFFPTESDNGIKGILNAPWKLNNDRTSVIGGAWNIALMEAAADRLAEWIRELATPDDPGGILDGYPRNLNRESDLHAPLTRRLMAHINRGGRLPDARGRMHELARLKHHPTDNYEAVQVWSKISKQPSGTLLHPSCYRFKERISRLDSVLRHTDTGPKALQKATLREWFHCHAIDTPEASTRAIALAWKTKGLLGFGFEAKACKIVLDASGDLRDPTECAICEDGVGPGSLYSVAPEILANPGITNWLVELGANLLARDVSEGQLINALRDAQRIGTLSWSTFWELASRSEPKMLEAFLKKNATWLRLKTKAGTLACREEYAEGVSDAPSEADLDIEYFLDLGISLPPILLGLPRTPERFRSEELKTIKYRHSRWVTDAFRAICKKETGKRPGQHPELVHDTQMPPGSTLTLRYANDTAFGCKVAEHFLEQCAMTRQSYVWADIHSVTRAKFYPKLKVPHPVWVLVCSAHPARLGGAIVPVQALTPAIETLVGRLDYQRQAAWSWLRSLHVETARSCLEIGLDTEDRNLSALSPALQHLELSPWRVLLKQAENLTDLSGEITGLWFDAQEADVTPERVPTARGPVPISEVYVTTSLSHARDRADQGVVCLSENGCVAWEARGATRLPSSSSWTYDAAVDGPLRLLDAWPELGRLNDLAPDLTEVDLLRVENLVEELGPTRKPSEIHFDMAERTLLIDVQSVGPGGREEALTTILDEMRSHLVTTEESCPWAPSARNLARQCCNADTDIPVPPQTDAETARRLAGLVGNDVEVFIELLPGESERLVDDGMSAARVAELALFVHGPGMLREMVGQGVLAHLNPPDRFGGSKARDFVRRHGLPEEFASSPSTRPGSEEIIRGPSNLPPLHDYQEEVVDGIRELLESGAGRRRAVISLPTGAGKTRVAVEAAVTLVMKSADRRAVLWIAQKEELCEQAVQSFAEVWAAKGTSGETMRVVRYWSGLTRNLEIDVDRPTVVVATIDTVRERLKSPEAMQLKGIGLMVVDECHAAIAKSYTELWRYLGLQVGGQIANDLEIPVLGLSATPWRGHNDLESRRLAARFDKRWLPTDQDGLHRALRQRGVLCNLEYRPLNYEPSLNFSEEERVHIDRYNTMPSSLLDTLSRDDKRNDTIVRAVENESAKSVLLFANTLAHAEHLSVLLNLRGLRAGAIGYKTNSAARQHFIEGFRAGDIRVLCNFGVLTTGFDAPRTDMVVIARPVFSPVLYMQMVGRGLRGVANGGTQKCTVVTLEDNLQEYSDRLAHHECARYFDSNDSV